MKKLLEKQNTFNRTLKILSFLSHRSITKRCIPYITGFLAKVNLLLNKPVKTNELNALAKS